MAQKPAGALAASTTNANSSAVDVTRRRVASSILLINHRRRAMREVHVRTPEHPASFFSLAGETTLLLLSLCRGKTSY
jgi:hypothetical protein